jgi:shikimate dehydrogenase
MPAFRFGLIGYPLEHSASASYFEKKFAAVGLENYSYQMFPLGRVEDVTELIARIPDLKGFNVTIPYKEKIIPFLGTIHPVASAIGAVNTVLVRSSGKEKLLSGYNTDADGFRNSLPAELLYSKALILGTGGSAKAVEYTLNKLGMEVLFVSRTSSNRKTIRYSEITKKLMKHFTFIVNCNPAGMYPDIAGMPPFPVQWIGPGHFVYDLIYNPEETLLLRLARKAGAKTQNGLRMFEAQAELSFRIWTER